MRKFEFTPDEIEYLKEIHTILKFGEFPHLFYAIGYDKVTGKRKMYICHKEESEESESMYAIAEIFNENNQELDNIEFNFKKEKETMYTYNIAKPWWKFW
jgi:hypothetical protein